MGFFEKLKQGLTKTKDNIVKQVDNLFKAFVKVDEDFLEELTVCAVNFILRTLEWCRWRRRGFRDLLRR